MGYRNEKEILSRLEQYLHETIDFRKKCRNDLNELSKAAIKCENEKMISCLEGILRIIAMLRDGRI